MPRFEYKEAPVTSGLPPVPVQGQPATMAPPPTAEHLHSGHAAELNSEWSPKDTLIIKPRGWGGIGRTSARNPDEVSLVDVFIMEITLSLKGMRSRKNKLARVYERYVRKLDHSLEKEKRDGRQRR